MSIDRVSVVTPTAPVAVADYQAIIAQLEARLDAFSGREIVDGSTIRAGTIISIGGVAYKATTDTSITGTPSAYVKITPAGATASAAFVASLSGVTWSHAYGGYYDGSGNLYAFDEARAINEGAGPTTPYTMMGKMAYLSGALDINGALSGVTTINGLIVADSWQLLQTASGAASVLPSGGTWAYFLQKYDAAGNDLAVSRVGKAAGGSTIDTGSINVIWRGLCFKTVL